MSRRLGGLLAVLLALVIGYGVVRVALPGARGGARGTVTQPPSAQRGSLERAALSLGEHDRIAVEIEIPAAAEVPTGGAHGGDCPQDKVCNILGITISQAHGLVVASIVPDGPADKAGIRPGDWLGQAADCPQTMLPRLRPGDAPRSLEWTVLRPKKVSEQSPPGETSKEPLES